MKTVYLNASYFPAVELLVGDRHRGDPALRRLPGDRRRDPDRRHRRLRRLPGRPSSNRSSSSPSSTRPTSRGWRRSTRSSTCSTPSPTWSTRPDAIDPGDAARRDRAWRASGSPTPTSREREAAGDDVWALRGRRPARAARPDPGPGRRDRRRQVDLRQAGRPLLRPAARAGAGRRPRPARRAAAGAAAPARDRPPGGLPLLRQRPREHRLRPARGEPRGDRGGGRRRSARPSSSRRCRTGSRPRSASAASSSRPASASSSPSPGRCSPSRAS